MTTSSLSLRTIRRRALTVAATLAGAATLAACDDPLGLRASLQVQVDTLSAFAMTGTPVTYPSAFDAGNSAVVRVSTDVGFDIAFDFTAAGAIQLVPARQVSATRDLGGAVASASRRVGLQQGTGTFESITRAPSGGYTYDSVLVVAPGVPVVMEVSSDVCQFSLASTIYAKIVVDSIDQSTRQLFFRATVDPNCGFRSFQPGVPKN
jgi:hypothetical protein